MKVRTIALSTFGSFLRNKVILLFCSLFICIILLMMSPLLRLKTMTTSADYAQRMQKVMLDEVSSIMSLVSGFGSLLAAWAAADSVGNEMKSGTILAVMARPLHRWQFLAGKYLGVLMLMAVYVVAMIGVTFFLAWLGGHRFHTSLWVLFVYPIVRYAIWAAISLFLVTLLHHVAVMSIVIILVSLVRFFESAPATIPAWIREPAHIILPLTNLLSEEHFLTVTRASVRPFPWTNHLIALTYGVNYALVFFLLAVVVFQRRGLSRD